MLRYTRKFSIPIGRKDLIKNLSIWPINRNTGRYHHHWHWRKDPVPCPHRFRCHQSDDRRWGGNRKQTKILHELGDTCAAALNLLVPRLQRAMSGQWRMIIPNPVYADGKIDEWMVQFKSWRNFIIDNYSMRLNEDATGCIDNLAFQQYERNACSTTSPKKRPSQEIKIKISHYRLPMASIRAG